MARYSAKGVHDDGAANETSLWIEQGTTVRRLKVYDVVVGSSATPADNAAEYSVYRATGGSPVGDSVTARPLDDADVAAETVPLSDLSAEPTGKLPLVGFPVNMRATFRWVAAPGSELVIAATANHGVGVEKLITSASFAFDTAIFWEE